MVGRAVAPLREAHRVCCRYRFLAFAFCRLVRSVAEEQTLEDQDWSSLVTIGLLGHPHVGKSSIINAIVARHVVSIGRVPGHTKHYQHIFLSPSVRLMDCPGVVFPNVDVSKQLQVCCIVRALWL